MDLAKLALGWALDRANERSTWIGIVAALAGKLAVHLTPEADTLVVNACLGLVALVSYAVKGGPVIVERKTK